jgi:hypothetical protein
LKIEFAGLKTSERKTGGQLRGFKMRYPLVKEGEMKAETTPMKKKHESADIWVLGRNQLC